ncbi:hypothetical protein BMI91_18910 [Thioclava sediminum]|uniref:O-antigen ligase-related domain-containing protein n=1 Tax=Thioclava sediminum TaxID=1915319 RepID=A0ABX3MSW4_9RHOB|nr:MULTISPECIES: O-antigen ligase family protein [Thioclava]OOY15624.1 hypothetical protein BMI85_14300 [Thioclava sp. DLFJ4-1]OOY22718.1 hypothetical protein BMI91_18910 [Thioclava sediminum]
MRAGAIGSVTPQRARPTSRAGGRSRIAETAALATAKLPWPVLLFVLSILLPFKFNLGPLAITGSRLVLMAFILPAFARVFSGRAGRILPVDWLFLFHALWLSVALAVNNPDRVIQQAGSVGLEVLGGYLIGRAYIRSREDFAALGKVLIWSVLILTPFSLYETKTGTTLIPTLIDKLPGMGTITYNFQEPRLGLERVQGPFAHPIHFGLYCSVVFAFAFVAFDGIKSLGWRVVASGLILLNGFLALSSGALLSLLLQLGLIGWYITFVRIEWRWWLLTGLCAFAYVTVDLLSNRSPIMVFLSYATFSAHTAYWRTIIFDWGLKNVWANPIFGIGLNDWVRPWYMYSGSMDNFWLVMAVRYGIPGFLLVTSGYVWGLFKVMFRDFSGDPRMQNFRRSWVFTFAGMTFTLCTVYVWESIYAFTFFLFGAGMWMLTEAVKERADEPEDAARPEARGTSYTRFAQTHRRGD